MIRVTYSTMRFSKLCDRCKKQKCLTSSKRKKNNDKTDNVLIVLNAFISLKHVF